MNTCLYIAKILYKGNQYFYLRAIAAFADNDDHIILLHHTQVAVDGISFSVEPGESALLTWRFTESGEVLFGCHEPGHYEGGMVGTIEILQKLRIEEELGSVAKYAGKGVFSRFRG